MRQRIKALDLFCCAGGAGVGYYRAGFEVVGIDIVERPRYPLDFRNGDALEFLKNAIEDGSIKSFDFIHASPPCQEACTLTVGTNQAMGWGNDHVQLIPELRRLLDLAALPYVIEQPDGKAPLRKDITLCGEMFGLGVLRHRNFELGNWEVEKPVHVKHRGRVRGWLHGVYYDGPYIAAYGSGGGKGSIEEMQVAMGIDWTDVREELTEAIPPAYTEWIGNAFVKWREDN